MAELVDCPSPLELIELVRDGRLAGVAFRMQGGELVAQIEYVPQLEKIGGPVEQLKARD